MKRPAQMKSEKKAEIEKAIKLLKELKGQRRIFYRVNGILLEVGREEALRLLEQELESLEKGEGA